MFLKKNVKKSRGRKYYQYVLVESVRTPKGPRHNIVVSLGDLSPRPPKEWLKLVSKVEEALIEQLNLFEQSEQSDKEVLDIIEKIKRRRQEECRLSRHLTPFLQIKMTPPFFT